MDVFIKRNNPLKVVALKSIESQQTDAVTPHHTFEHIYLVKAAKKLHNINFNDATTRAHRKKKIISTVARTAGNLDHFIEMSMVSIIGLV